MNPIKVSAGSIIAPMPGIIIEIACTVGDKVRTGQELVVLEAMKMQNPLPAPIDGEVKAIYVKVRDAVKTDQVLIDIG